MDIGQPHVTATVPEGKGFVVDPQTVQHGGPEVVEGHRLLNGTFASVAPARNSRTVGFCSLLLAGKSRTHSPRERQKKGRTSGSPWRILPSAQTGSELPSMRLRVCGVARHREAAGVVSDLRTALFRVCAGKVWSLWSGLPGCVLAQGPRCLSVLHGSPDGSDGCAPGRPCQSACASSAMGDLSAEAAPLHLGRPAPGNDAPVSNFSGRDTTAPLRRGGRSGRQRRCRAGPSPARRGLIPASVWLGDQPACASACLCNRRGV